MTHLDDPHELEIVEPVDLDAVMFRLDVTLASDADRHTLYSTPRARAARERFGVGGWGRADLLVDPDGTVRYA